MESSPWRIALGKAHRLRSSKRAALISASTMQLLKRESWHLLLLVCLLLLLRTTAEAARKNNSDGNGVEDADAQQHQEQFRDIQSVPYLVEMIGNKLYAFVNRPKYKFYIYMTVGTFPNKENTIVFLNLVCNLLYGISILAGFIYLPRGKMLIGTLATLFVGPALVLILLGSVGLILAAFAVYPVTSVSSMWLFFFLKSQMAQVLGRKLGLDHDSDGDCDSLDLLHCVASTKWGSLLGLPKLHKILHESMMDPFQEIYRRLDEIQHGIKSLDMSLNKAKKAE